MKRLMLAVAIATTCASSSAVARAAPKSGLDDPDIFAIVMPDDLLGSMTRRKWLTLYPVDGREYWAAWDCKGKPCDTARRAHERATAKLIPRLPTDPKPEDAPLVPRIDRK